jgi:hypothetical protein
MTNNINDTVLHYRYQVLQEIPEMYVAKNSDLKEILYKF